MSLEESNLLAIKIKPHKIWDFIPLLPSYWTRLSPTASLKSDVLHGSNTRK